MADYKFVVADGSALLGELRALQARVNLRLDDPSDCTFRLDARQPTAALVMPLNSDIVVYRDGQPIMRAVVGSVVDTIDASSHYVDVNAVDYRARLDRRILLSNSNHNGEPDMDIAWGLIDDAQNETNGGMGISLGAVPAGVNRKISYLAGETVKSNIDRLAVIDNGFDWDINPERQFVAWRGGRGESRGRILDYGGSVSEVQVHTDPTLFANSIRIVGDNTTSATVLTQFDPPYGRWDVETNIPTIDDQDFVDDTGTELLSRYLNDFVSYDLILRDSTGVQAWGGPGDIGLGDTVRVVIKSGRLNINEQTRVRAISVDVNGDGSERVMVEAGGRRRRFDDRMREAQRRLNDLELLTE